LTASLPLQLNGSNNIVSSSINLASSEVAGTLPISNGGTNSSTALNNDRIMVSSSGAIVESAVLTNGQLLIGSTSSSPVAANITGSSDITVTNGAGTIGLDTIQPITTASSPTFASETLSAATNQLVLGTTNTTTISAAAPSTSRTITLPDPGATGTSFALSTTTSPATSPTFVNLSTNTLYVSGVSTPQAALINGPVYINSSLSYDSATYIGNQNNGTGPVQIASADSDGFQAVALGSYLNASTTIQGNILSIRGGAGGTTINATGSATTQMGNATGTLNLRGSSVSSTTSGTVYASAGGSTTLTAAQTVGGLFFVTGATAITLTTTTAALLASAMSPSIAVGDTVSCVVFNATSQPLTIAMGTNMTAQNISSTIATNSSDTLYFVCTATTPTFTVYF
jgi:hypothetical protein